MPKTLNSSKALCKGKTNIFFDERNRRRVYEAKSICHRCDLKEECGEWAIHNHVFYGIWGGMDRKEIAIQRARRGIVLPPHYGYTRVRKENNA